ncbi:DNA recombination protein RecF [Candidatus Saccharibacteria bacterium]|nr:MAG: DNA recombination protein RecF [Candidatus Saccharibacteria bacterium]
MVTMLTTIRLQQFRSYRDASFEISPGVNIVVGPNASGKTNLLEAVLLLARGSSYRAKDSQLVQSGADWARLDADLPTQHRTIKLSGPNMAKSFEFDGQQLARLHHSRMLPTVLFEPNNLFLFGGAPEARRAFLDDLIEQTDPSYASIRKQYRRVLAHRNALLKHSPHDIAQQLFVWNIRLSELAGQMVQRRTALVAFLNERAPALYGSLASDQKQLGLTYLSRFPLAGYETALLHKLDSSVALETARGFTLYGAHRDDLQATLNEKPVEAVASRGEIRSIVLVLKLLELAILAERTGKQPLLLLDDVFSELDSHRRQALTKHVAGYQTFITTTDADVVIQHFTNCHIIPLNAPAANHS